MRRLTSADLFSGAGGLTEGFRQAGFEVLASLDNWGPAAETHSKNFPRTEMFHADILEFDSSELPEIDVLIGSPPCTEFSYSNRGGHGNLDLGMKFVLRFLRFVHDLKPRYWAMENVPRLAQSLPPRVALRKLGLQEDGFLEIPIRKVLNSADYGAPQRRLRLFSGKFPLPEPTHCEPGALDAFGGGLPWVTVGDVVHSLPDPLKRGEPPSEVTDPNYGFKIPVGELSDHFMDTVLTREEVEINRKSKTDHSWYGRMAFPDPTNRPARTVMATQTGVSRETLVLEWEVDGKKVYRRPTIRECAAFQTFPLTYQFWGKTAETRYRLVGNAVPPVLAAAVARSIASKAGVQTPRSPILTKRCFELPPPVSIAHRSSRFNARRFPVDRKFRDHIPGSRTRGFRVDIDNLGTGNVETPSPGTARTLAFHLRAWTARLYVGSGKEFTSVVPTFEQALDQLVGCCATSDQRLRAERLGDDLERRVAPWLPDATTLQAAWAGKIARSNTGPREILWRLARVVDRHFPPDRFHTVVGPVSPPFPRIERSEMPIRTAAFMFAAQFATEVVNRMAPGATLGQRALEQFALQSGMVLEEVSQDAEIPRVGQMMASAIESRLGQKAGRSSQELDAA
jgi:DNA (cytosine-5)-methyltransferase 1